MPAEKMDLNILIGGAAGQGMETVIHFLGKALVREGYQLISTKDYMSRVRGGHNFFTLRIAGDAPHAPSKETDLLVALNEETYFLHRENLSAQGKVLFDPELFSLPESEDRGIGIRMKSLARQAGNPIMSNTVAVGALLVLLGLKSSTVETLLTENFADKEGMAAKNIAALQSGCREAAAFCEACFTLPKKDRDSSKKRLYIDGNQVLGMAALASGCQFLSAYPMTPSTGIMTYLAEKALQFELVVEQAEDEIAAINMALGASYAGARSMVSTSGGGFSLMVEGLSLCGMTETPLVVVVAMRPGPATGFPTRTEQGDLSFAIHAGHGEFPRAVLSATTLEDAFTRLNKAFELADKFQVPVIFLSDQNFADTARSLEPFDFSSLQYRRYIVTAEELQRPYQRYRYTENGVSPRALPGQFDGEVVLVDSDEHDEKGNITEDAQTRRSMMDKRMHKLKGLAAEMDEPVFYGNPDGDILLMGWGSTFGTLRESVNILASRGHKAALLHFADIWPLPTVEIKRLLPQAKKSFCMENNATGQFAALLRRETGLEPDHLILKYDGRPFFPEEIVEEVQKYV